MKTISVLVFVLFQSTVSLTTQTFISQKQSIYSNKTMQPIEVTGERKVIINGNTFEADLPYSPKVICGHIFQI